jgi:hypothetical protein
MAYNSDPAPAPNPALTTLLPQERPLHGTKHHWMMMLELCRIPIVIALVTLLVLGTAQWWLMYLEVYVAEPLGWPNIMISQRFLEVRIGIAGIILAICGFWIIASWFRWQAMTVILTNQRFIIDRILWPQVALVIGMDRINDVSVEQTSTGSMFGYSRLKINGGSVDLHYIPHDRAKLFSQKIFVIAKEKPADPPVGADKEEERGPSAAVIMNDRDPGQPI